MNLIKNPQLTPQERRVLDLVAAGKGSKEIARALEISPRTVDDHRQAVLKKLGVPNSAALIHKVLSARIAELEARHGAN